MFRLIILAACISLFAACAELPVSVDYDEHVNFSGLHQFAWAPETHMKTNNPAIDSDTLLHGRILEEIESWLLRRGYRKVPPSLADFLVSYRFSVEERNEIAMPGGYFGYPSAYGYYGRPSWAMGYGYAYPPPYTYHYQLGTLIVDLLHPQDQKLIWRGTLADEFRAAGSPLERRQDIAAMVAQVLQHFPPQN